MKPTDVLNSNLIGITTLPVLGSLCANHQEFLAVHRHLYIFADLMTICYQSKMPTDSAIILDCCLITRQMSSHILKIETNYLRFFFRR